MTKLTHSTAVQPIPWSPAETAAYRALVEHTGGIDTAPPCPRCNSPERDCPDGKALRLALRDATRARSGQTTPGARR